MATIFTIYKYVVRTAAALAAAGVLFFLVLRAAAPGGEFSVTTDLVDPAPFVSEPKPSERLASAERGDAGRLLVPLTGSPIYLDLTPPGDFEEVTVSAVYENAGQPIVEIGALASALDGQFDVRPAENRLLDSLSWPRLASGRLSLYQRTPRYSSLDEFFADPPERPRLAVYRAAPPVPFRLPGYEPSGRLRELDVSIRGRTRLLTYLKDESLDLTFLVQDMNREPGADPVTVSVYRRSGGVLEPEAEPLARTVLDDDGNAGDDQRSSKLRTVAVTLLDPPEGAYQIEFTAPPDVFIRKMITPQRKLVFLDALYLGDNVGFSDRMPPRTVQMSGRRLVARTAHAEGLQTLSVAGRDLAVLEPHVRYAASAEPGETLTPVAVPKGDVILETDGLFALSEEEFFDPLPFVIGWHAVQADLDRRGIDFILTAYEPPESSGGLKMAAVTFDLRRLSKTEDGAYRFALVAPGPVEAGREVRVASVTFTLKRRPTGWMDGLKRLFARSGEAGKERSGEGTKPGSGEEILADGVSFWENPP